MSCEPIFLACPYEDKPWFYVKYDDPTQFPAALPYYSAKYVEQLKEQAETQERQIQRLEDEMSDLRHQVERLQEKVSFL